MIRLIRFVPKLYPWIVIVFLLGIFGCKKDHPASPPYTMLKGIYHIMGFVQWFGIPGSSPSTDTINDCDTITYMPSNTLNIAIDHNDASRYDQATSYLYDSTATNVYNFNAVNFGYGSAYMSFYKPYNDTVLINMFYYFNPASSDRFTLEGVKVE